MFAPLMFVASWGSHALGFRDPAISLLWLPTSLMLVGLLTRGYSVLLPGVAGLVACGLFAGLSPERTAWMVAATVVAPTVAAAMLRRLRAPGRVRSHLVQTGQLLAVLCLVQAPLAAVFGIRAFGAQPLPDVAPWIAYASYTAVEAMSAIVFVRAALACMPGDGSGFCPVAGISGGVRALRRCHFLLIGALFLAGAGAALAVSRASGQLAAFLMFPLFAVALITSVSAGRRMSGLVTLACVAMIVVLRVRVEPFSTTPQYLSGLGQFVLLITVGSALTLFLNALSEERQLQAQRLRLQAETNEVSDLPNLRALQAMLSECSRNERCSGLTLVEVGVMDAMRWADLAGRTRLMAFEREFGELLQSEFRDEARLVAHIGTGRYVLVLPAAPADEVLRRRVRAVAEARPLVLPDRRLTASCSIGVVDIKRGTGQDPESLLAALSIAQQTASASASRFHRLDLAGTAVEAYRDDLAWVETVRHAVQEGRIAIHAQPIVPAAQADGELHYEVLARMIDADGAIVPPARFLPALSQARLLEQFDQLVIATTLDHLASRPALLQATAVCAINVTGPTICDPDFPDWLSRALASRGIAPSKLVIEITESESIARLDSALNNVRALQAAGIAVAVDDFGTGQATFDYIRRFAPQWLKIDGSFVRAFDDSALDREIVLSIVRIGAALGARTVAEWVENDALAERMRAIGVDYLQGYALGRPIPIAELVAPARAEQAAPAGIPAPGRDAVPV